MWVNRDHCNTCGLSKYRYPLTPYGLLDGHRAQITTALMLTVPTVCMVGSLPWERPKNAPRTPKFLRILYTWEEPRSAGPESTGHAHAMSAACRGKACVGSVGAPRRALHQWTDTDERGNIAKQRQRPHPSPSPGMRPYREERGADPYCHKGADVAGLGMSFA